jgi:hypothetical protein
MSTSTAIISNDVHVVANSGDNVVKDTSTSSISTGKTFAAANIVNIANTNVVGRNWILAIINIFGDFNGNIAFGKPDLWLGEQVSADTVVKNGTLLTYKITVINKGDSVASKVNVTSVYDKNHLDIVDSDFPYTIDKNGNLVFDIGTLSSDDAKELIFHGRVKNTNPGTEITNTATVVEHESDNNNNDNRDTTTIVTFTLSFAGGMSSPSSGGAQTITPVTNSPTVSVTPLFISVTRETPNLTIAGTGVSGKEVIIIRNHTNATIPATSFDDILYTESGSRVRTETFDIGDILPNEEVTVTYDISFDQGALSGTYTFASELHYTHLPSSFYYGNGSIIYTTPQQFSLNKREVIASTTIPVTNHVAATRTTSHRNIKQGEVLRVVTGPKNLPFVPVDTGAESKQAESPYFGLGTFLIFIASGSSLFGRFLRRRMVYENDKN